MSSFKDDMSLGALLGLVDAEFGIEAYRMIDNVIRERDALRDELIRLKAENERLKAQLAAAQPAPSAPTADTQDQGLES